MTLTEQCLALPYQERLQLFFALKDTIRPINPNRGDLLLGIMADLYGCAIPQKSRESRFVWARIMVAYQLHLEGYTSYYIGKAIGKDRATITYMKTRMAEVLQYPVGYGEIINIWKQFQNRLQYETD